MFDYTQYLQNQLNILKQELGITQDLVIEDEQIFAKRTDDELIPNKIYVVLKKLQATITNEGLTQPIQLIAVSEENSSDYAITLLSEFAKRYNWVKATSGTTQAKQQYSTPITVNNFQEIGIGYRSVLFLSGTLFILEDLLDIQNLTIDGESASFISNGATYVMSGDTQQFTDSNISTTVKNSSTIAVSFVLIFKKSNYMKKIFKIMNGINTGDETFAITFSLDSTDIDYSFNMNMKLQNAQVTGAVNNFPTINVSFIK